jgi:hypothetical protein
MRERRPPIDPSRGRGRASPFDDDFDEEERALLMKKPFSSVGGRVEHVGLKAEAQVLGGILESQTSVDPDHHTHGFHSYPARMHPAIAAGAIQAFAPKSGLVVDPFVGSGTVLVESLLAGHGAVGLDVSPFALRLAEVKCSLRSDAEVDTFLGRLAEVAEASTERVKNRVDVRAEISPMERSWYEIHVLKELAGLLAEIRKIKDDRDRRALEMVFSSLVVKFSRQVSDTAEQRVEKRIRKGLVTEFFARKGTELADRWRALDFDTPDGTLPPRLAEVPARSLRKHFLRDRAGLIVSSPPYGGTYDYVDHHARRVAWLGIDMTRLDKQEIGARRMLEAPGAIQRWDDELGAALEGMRSIITDDANVVLVLGDGEIHGRRIRAVDQMERLAPQTGFVFVAAAEQPRRDWKGGPLRSEALILLRPGEWNRRPEPMDRGEIPRAARPPRRMPERGADRENTRQSDRSGDRVSDRPRPRDRGPVRKPRTPR